MRGAPARRYRVGKAGALALTLMLAVAPADAAGPPTPQDAAPAIGEPSDQSSQALSLEADGDTKAASQEWAQALASYEAALALRLQLAKASPRDADRSGALAETYAKVARAQAALERHDAAAKSLLAAQKLRVALLKAAPKDDGRKHDLAMANLGLAEALLAAERAEEALKPSADAVKAMRAFATGSHGAAKAFDLATALLTDARLRLVLGRQDEASSSAGEARALLEPLADGNPAARHGLARALLVSGDSALERDDFDAAKAAFQESFTAAEAGSAGDATDLDRAAALERLGWAALRRGEAEEALRAYEWSRAILAAVAGRQPRNVEPAFMAASLANRIGATKLEAGDSGGALAVHGEALAGFRALIALRPEIWRYRRGVVEALRGLAAAGESPAQRLQQAIDLVAASKKAGILPEADAWLADDLREALAGAG